MVKLVVNKNKVYLSKLDPEFQRFAASFLIKYEEVSKIDYFSSRKGRKRFKTVKERRDLYTETDEFIIFPRGLLDMIPANEYEVISFTPDAIVTPQVSKDEIRTALDSFDLRDDQVVAVNKGLIARRGVIQLPTATGKSAIITTIIKMLLKSNPDLKALVLAPTLSTVENINKTLVSNGIDSKVFGHPEKSISSPVTTSLVQSLISASSDDPTLLDGVGAVFYDECLPSNAKILLPDLTKKSISEIFNDDSITEVMSYNVGTDQYEVKKILRKFKTPYNDRFWKVYYEDPLTSKTRGVTLTPNHKLWTPRGYVQAQDLTTDDSIRVDIPSLRGTRLLSRTVVRVKRVVKNVGSVAEFKYNIEVEGNHNYFASDVLVSNCHHLKCDTWNRLNSLISNAEYSLGFSALSIDKSEIYKTDIRDLSYYASLIVGCSGRVLMHMDPSYYINKGIIALPAVLRVSHQVVFPRDIDESNWSQVSKLGLMSTARTNKIAEISSIFSKYGRKVLILVSEKDYAFYLGNFLGKLGLKFGVSFGSGKGFVSNGLGHDQETVDYLSEDSMEVVSQLEKEDFNILIATSHLDEGVDIKSLDACILACGGKKDRRIVQRVGRVLRKSKTGKYAYVVDFTDQGSRVLSRQSRERLNMYKKDIGVPQELIYDGILVSEIEKEFKLLEGLI